MENNTSPRRFSRGHLYWLLSDPVYAGDIRHKDQIVPGQHEAIIDRYLWVFPSTKTKCRTMA
jgi:site-specific DNA recombinase